MSDRSDRTKPLPERIRLLKWGLNESTEGPVVVNEHTLRSFAATQRRIGRERVPLDFEHNTVEGTPEYNRTSEPRPIAAMGTPVVIPGEGLFLEQLTYTATGQANADQYEDLSAAPLLNKDRVVVGLHSGALTRAGAVYGAVLSADELRRLTTEGVTLARLSAGRFTNFAPPSDASVQPKTTPNIMAETISIETLAAQVAQLSQSLGDRLAALEGRKPADLVPLAARLDAVEKTVSGTPDLVALRARIEALEKAHKASADGALQAERARLVPLFASEGRCPVNPATGKAYTAEELAALDIPTLKLLHANTPVTVPLNARRPAAEKTTKPDAKGADRAAGAWQHLEK